MASQHPVQLAALHDALPQAMVPERERRTAAAAIHFRLVMGAPADLRSGSSWDAGAVEQRQNMFNAPAPRRSQKTEVVPSFKYFFIRRWGMPASSNSGPKAT